MRDDHPLPSLGAGLLGGLAVGVTDMSKDAVEEPVMILGLIEFRHQTPVLILGQVALLCFDFSAADRRSERPRQLIRTASAWISASELSARFAEYAGSSRAFAVTSAHSDGLQGMTSEVPLLRRSSCPVRWLPPLQVLTVRAGCVANAGSARVRLPWWQRSSSPGSLLRRLPRLRHRRSVRKNRVSSAPCRKSSSSRARLA